MNKTSIVHATIAEVIMYFIGATASNKLSVVIVGSTIKIKAIVLWTAPRPTVIPPKHPITNNIALISPKR